MAAAFKSKLEGFVGHGSDRHLKPVVPFLSPLALDKTVVISSLKIIFRTAKSASRLLLGHLSSCVPSILRCFGPKYGQICKDLPKHHKLLVLGVPDDLHGF
jgi:hypothetical protein